MSVRFIENRRGGLTLDRDSLHESEGYKRQVEALKQLPERKAVMGEKMTLTEVRDYHLTIAARHEAAGSDFEAYEKHKAMADAIDAHLTQQAQAVDVGAIHAVIVDMEERARNGGDAFPDEFESWADKLTAALPNADGKEG